MAGNFRGKSEKALKINFRGKYSAATIFVATPIIMDLHITIGINFRGWENFVTAKSTTKITKISTP